MVDQYDEPHSPDDEPNSPKTGPSGKKEHKSEREWVARRRSQIRIQC